MKAAAASAMIVKNEFPTYKSSPYHPTEAMRKKHATIDLMLNRFFGRIVGLAVKYRRGGQNMKFGTSSFLAGAVAVALTVPVFAGEPSVDFDRGTGTRPEFIQTAQLKALRQSAVEKKAAEKGEKSPKDKVVKVILSNGDKVVNDELTCKLNSCDPNGCNRKSTSQKLDSSGIDALLMRDSFNKCVEGNFPLSPEIGALHSYKVCNGSMCYSCNDKCNNWVEVEIEVGCNLFPPNCHWVKKSVCKGYTHACKCVSGC